MQHSIFISYRRDDSEGEAGRLYDDLVRAYGDNSVFMDVSGIAPGLDFRKAIDDNVAGCGVFLAVIGSQWATIADPDGKRRLDDPNDFVRLEVASALARNIAVIPVLVHDARMPHPEQLPENIKDLAYRNSVEISHARWNSDVKLLVDALKQYVNTNPATEHQPVHAAVPVQLPPPVSTEPLPVESSASKSKLLLIVGGVVALLLLAVVGYLTLGGKSRPRSGEPQRTAASDQPNALTGVWRNTEVRNASDALVALRINGSGPGYNVEPVGRCPTGECGWGTHTIILKNGLASGAWTPQNTPQEISQHRTVTLTLRPQNGKLSVQVTNTWLPDPNSKPRTSDFQYTFERQQ